MPKEDLIWMIVWTILVDNMKVAYLLDSNLKATSTLLTLEQIEEMVKLSLYTFPFIKFFREVEIDSKKYPALFEIIKSEKLFEQELEKRS